MENLASVAEITAQMTSIFCSAEVRQPDLIREGPEPYEVSFIWE